MGYSVPTPSYDMVGYVIASLSSIIAGYLGAPSYDIGQLCLQLGCLYRPPLTGRITY